MKAIRGATSIEKNEEEDIKNSSIELFKEIFTRNNIDVSKIKIIIFSCTNDITKAYPGKYIREYFGINKTAIMHFNEMYVEESLPLCIRTLVVSESDNTSEEVYHIYLKNAQKLRDDLSFENIKGFLNTL